MKKSYRILQLQFQLQFYRGTHPSIRIQPTRVHMHPENSPSSIKNPILQAEDRESFEYNYIQRAKRPSFQKRNSTHRRQRDLLEIHQCVLQDLPRTFQTFQSFQYFQYFQTFQSFQTFQLYMTFQPIQAILQVPVPPGFPPHYSILQLECIFYIFYKFYSSIGFHRKLHRVPVEQYKLQTFYKHSILQGKGDVAIWVMSEIFPICQ